jgi:hypothetical protein
VVTTISITEDRVSIRSAQWDWKSPTVMKGAISMTDGVAWPQAKPAKFSQAIAQDRNRRPVVTA